MIDRVVTASVDIEAPPETVFEHFSDSTLAKRWIPGLIDVDELTPGTRIGSSSRLTYRLNGRTIESTERIIAIDSPNLVSSEVTTGGVQSIQSIRLEGQGRGVTRVQIESEITRVSGVEGALVKLVSVDQGSVLTLAVTRLKAVVEDPAVKLPTIERVPVKWSLAVLAVFSGICLALGVLISRIVF